MRMLAFTKLGRSRLAVTLLPWALLIATVVGCVSREVTHRGMIDRLGEIEQLVMNVSKAANNEAEREAMLRLAQWTSSKGVAVSISAYSRMDGQSIQIADVSNRKGNEIAFQVKFDADGDHVPERAHILYLKDPQHIGILMME